LFNTQGTPEAQSIIARGQLRVDHQTARRDIPQRLDPDPPYA
jgi:hypothetical protein